MNLVRKADSRPSDGTPGHSPYGDDERAAIRKAYRLPEHADVDAWVTYDRDLCVWRQRCATWLVRLLASPGEYLAKTLANRARLRPELNTPAWRGAWEDAMIVVRGQLLELAAPGQRPVSLANEILQRGNASVFMELVHGGWLPPKPKQPGMQPRRPRIADEERQANAEANAEDWGPR